MRVDILYLKIKFSDIEFNNVKEKKEIFDFRQEIENIFDRERKHSFRI